MTGAVTPAAIARLPGLDPGSSSFGAKRLGARAALANTPVPSARSLFKVRLLMRRLGGTAERTKEPGPAIKNLWNMPFRFGATTSYTQCCTATSSGDKVGMVWE